MTGHHAHYVIDADDQVLATTGTCSLFIDLQLDAAAPRPGDWIATDAGSRYLVDKVRAVKHRGHRQQQRFSMRCLRLPKHSEAPADVTVIWLQWYPRGARR